MNATMNDIREHMEVVGADGMHVGTVDHMDGNEIKLTAKDSNDGKHHFLPATMVVSVDDKVHLSMSRDQAWKQWRSE